MSDPVWKPLADVLKACADAGERPRFWLRDDDAVAPSAALDRLLDMARRSGAPVALAVIPALAETSLATLLAGTDRATILVHGWRHANHAGADEKRQELGPHRPAAAVLAELEAAWKTIARLFGESALPVLVPPWNRIDAALAPHLGALGYHAISAYGRPKPSPLPMINATVDLIDWRGSKGRRPIDELVAEIVAQLRHGLADPLAPPVGILTHHRVHDDAAWAFLEILLEVTTRDARCVWLSVRDLAQA